MARDPREIAQDAAGESVTVDRLTEPVVDALGADEQPQHILEGDSVDYRPEGDDETERLFSRVDTVVSFVTTSERILVVVPRAVTDEVYTIEYDEVSECSVETGQFPAVQLDTETRSFSMNLSAKESPEPVATHIRRQQTTDEIDLSPPEPTETAGGDPPADTTKADLDDGDSATDPLDRIERLAELHDQGVLTDEEFESKKQQLLDEL